MAQGSGITVLDNYSEIVDAHSASGSDDDVHAALKANGVALFSAFNSGGRILIGLLSDQLQNYVSRSTLLAFDLILMAAAQFFFAFVSLSTLYAATIMTAVAYGGFWLLVPSLVADIFGPAHFGGNNGFMLVASMIGSELFYDTISVC